MENVMLARKELPELESDYLHTALVEVWNSRQERGLKPGSDKALCQDRQRQELTQEIENAWRKRAKRYNLSNAFPFSTDYLIQEWLGLRKAGVNKQQRIGRAQRTTKGPKRNITSKLTAAILNATAGDTVEEWKRNIATLGGRLGNYDLDMSRQCPDLAKELANLLARNGLCEDALTAARQFSRDNG